MVPIAAVGRYEAIGEGIAKILAPAGNLFELHCETLSTQSHVRGVRYFGSKLSGWEGGTDLVDLEAETIRKLFIEQRLARAETAPAFEVETVNLTHPIGDYPGTPQSGAA